MKIVKAITPRGCTQGACPSFHLTASGAILVQGDRLPVNHRNSLAIPAHEELVSIPREVFDALVADYGSDQLHQDLKSCPRPGDAPSCE